MFAQRDLNVCADARDIAAANACLEKDRVEAGNIKESVELCALFKKIISRALPYIMGGSDSFNYPVIKKLKDLATDAFKRVRC